MRIKETSIFLLCVAILLTLFSCNDSAITPPDTSIYSSNPDMNGQFFDAVLVNRNPDCRCYATDANDGDYGSSLISDISNGISDAVSDVHIDMVIASVLISMGMLMLPPVLISLPFKLLLFVLVDGWRLVAGNLLGSFSIPSVPGITS